MGAEQDIEKVSSVEGAHESSPVDESILVIAFRCSLIRTANVYQVALDHDEEPKNWSQRRKWTITILTSLGDLVCLMSSTMMAPALPEIARDMDTTLEAANMSLSIFVLAFAFGPMILAPFTEVFGRRNVWLLCSSWYVVWNMTCGFARSKGLLVAARLLAGLGSSVEYVVSLIVSLLHNTSET